VTFRLALAEAISTALAEARAGAEAEPTVS